MVLDTRKCCDMLIDDDPILSGYINNKRGKEEDEDENGYINADMSDNIQ